MTPELQQEMSVLLSPPFIAGFITWLVTQIVMIVFMIRHKPRNRKVEEAVRRGHAVKAYIVGRVYKEYNSPEESVKERQIYRCDYEYVVNGKKMRYRYHAYTMPPSPLTLYYIDDPKKVFPGDGINNYWRDMAGLRYAVIFIIPLVLGVLVVRALGGI